MIRLFSRLVYVVNDDGFFLSHRLALARAAREAGAEVFVMTADSGHAEEVRSEGFSFRPLPLDERDLSPLADARTLISLVTAYREIQPDLVHHNTVKPIVFGSLAARLSHVPAVVNTMSGLGYLFGEGTRPWLLRSAVKPWLRIALGHPRSRTVFHNQDDLERLVAEKIVPRERALVIRGSGVDTDRFRPSEERPGEPVVMLVGRMLWEKGVGEFVDAARQLRQAGTRARFVLVGGPRAERTRSVPAEMLASWHDEGVVEWWGQKDPGEMPEVLASASIVVLGSNREGLPKVLLEAAACARPLIATNVPGCREIVRHGMNGILIPYGDSRALAEAIRSLLDEPELRHRYGRTAREIVEREFSETGVAARTLDLYRKLLGEEALSGDRSQWFARVSN